MKSVGLFLFVLNVTFSFAVFAQQKPIGTWTAYPSYNTTTGAIKDANGKIWVASNGGIYSIENGNVSESYSVIDGLYSNSIRAITYDTTNHGLWIGYIDGTLDFFDIEKQKFSPFSDISRNTRFNSKSINDFMWIEDDLYISTNFGIVVWNTAQKFVISSLVNFGDLGTGLRTNTVLIQADTLYAVTEAGLAYANYKTDDLVLPSAWKIRTNAQLNLNSEALKAHIRESFIFLSSINQNIRLSGSTSVFQTGFNGAVRFYLSYNNRFFGVTDRSVYEINGTSPVLLYSLPNTLNRNTHLLSDSDESNSWYLGNTSFGMYKLENNTVTDTLAPDGPFLNFFTDMYMDGSTLVSASSFSPGRITSTVRESGFYIFDGTIWKSFNLATNQRMRVANAESFYKTTVGKDYYAFGSWGKGIALYDKLTDSIRIYNSTNTPITGIVEAPAFIVVTGMFFDSDDNLWVATLDHLIKMNPKAEKFNIFDKIPLINLSDQYFGLFVDSFNQFWMPLRGSRGLLVMNFDEENPNSSTGVRLTSSSEQGFLPSDEITAIAQDRRGEIWVGTTRGLVRYLFPDRVIEGNSNDRRAEYLRNVTNDTIYFRDIDVTAIAVDAANQKWVGTSANGLWQISENGERILKQFTTDNSPIPSNTIRSITIDNSNGTVYVATGAGLVSYSDVTTQAFENRSELRVYPNPLVYENLHQETVIIEGLAQETTVRILTSSGLLIDEFQAKGGRVQWTPKQRNGEKLPSGVYFILSVNIDGKKTAVGKLAVIR